MSGTVAPWGREIAVEHVGGVPYRMYAPRVRRVVFGLPHPDLGEEVAAVVVDDGSTADRPDLDEYVAGELRSALASFAIATRWRFQTEELPVLGSEKVDKHALAAELVAEQPSPTATIA